MNIITWLYTFDASVNYGPMSPPSLDKKCVKTCAKRFIELELSGCILNKPPA